VRPDVIARGFAKHGIEAQVDRWDTNRANVVAQVRTGGPRPGLLFLCHLDVVGPGEEAWDHRRLRPLRRRERYTVAARWT